MKYVLLTIIQGLLFSGNRNYRDTVYFIQGQTHKPLVSQNRNGVLIVAYCDTYSRSNGLRLVLYKVIVTIILLSDTTQLSAKLIPHQGPNLVYCVLPCDIATNPHIEVLGAGTGALASDGEAVTQN